LQFFFCCYQIFDLKFEITLQRVADLINSDLLKTKLAQRLKWQLNRKIEFNEPFPRSTFHKSKDKVKNFRYISVETPFTGGRS